MNPHRPSPLRHTLAAVGAALLAAGPGIAQHDFTVSIANAGPDSFALQWSSAEDFIDTVQVSEDLVSWQTLPGGSTRELGAPGAISLAIPRPDAPRRFYRILRVPDPGVSITEFMAINDATIPDPAGLGNGPDWIELYNGGSDAVSLDGYFLTDSKTNLTKWRFPDVSLEPGAFLVVHATGNDQRNPAAGVLEADFRLDRDGGYLALLTPDGNTILSEFHYASQFEDVAYGVPFVTRTPNGGEIPDHVVAQWNLDEPSGPLTDVAARGSGAHTIEVAGATYLEPALVNDGGSSVSFASTTDTPSTANAADLGVSANPQFTAEGFFAITDAEAGTGLNYIMGSRRIATGWSVWLRDGGKLAFVFDGTGGLTGTEFFGNSFVDDGEVHHFALVVDRDGGTTPGTGIATLYLDGLIDHIMDNIPADHMDADDGFFLGRRHNSPFGGRLDMVRFSKAALDPADFLDLSDFTGGDGTSALQPVGLAGFLRDPTPGAANGPAAELTGPRISSVAHSPDHGTASEDIVVTATIAPRRAPIHSVALTYRTMYETSPPSIPMHDDGTGADALAGDGIYSAAVPSTAFSAGQMVRWFVTTTDADGNASRKPEFLRPLESAEYFGTVIRDPTLPATTLTVLDWFAPDPTWYRVGSSNTREYSQASLYYDGEFIDNFRIRTRGRTAANAAKPYFKFDFYNGGHMRVRSGLGRVEEMNLNSFHGENIWSRSFMRSVLTYAVLRDNGVPTPYSFHVHVRRNGEFFGLCAMEEQVDAEFLDRHDLNQDGSLYKASGNGNLLKTYPEGDWDKEQPDNLDFAELVEFINGISPSRPLPEREAYVFDNVTIPVMVNYLATFAVTLNHDRIQHNYYMYRDTGRSNEWMMIPWDVDRSFSEGGQLTDARNTDIFYGDSDHWRVASDSDVYNRLYDALFDIPRTREMYLRRLRTLTDRWHGDSSARLKATLAGLTAQVELDAALDEALWGYNYLRSGNNGITNSINTRRGQLAAVAEIPPSGVLLNHETLLGAAAPARYHIAAADEGTAWQLPEFDDSSWAAADTGLGFDRSSDPSISYAHHFGHDEATATAIRTAMEDAQNPSLYLRVPFEVASIDGITALALNLRFDDGFVAWLNGVRVASENAPSPLEWNSGASEGADETPARGDGIDFDISSHLDALATGPNVLAVQVMNTGLTSSDLLCLPTIVASRAQSPAGVIAFGQIESNPPSGNQDEEFIELVNTSASSIDISDWQLRGGVQHRFLAGTVIPAGDSLFVSPRVEDFRSRATSPTGGQALFVQGNYDGHLSNAGELVELVDLSGTVIATVTTPVDLSPAQQFLRITELMFNPPPPTPAEFAAGFSNNDEFEFIELANIGDAPLPLDNIAFTDGISYAFPDGITLAPAERLVVPRNLEAFQLRYGAGLNTTPTEYRDPLDDSNNLQNSGETIKLEDSNNSTILDFRYDDTTAEGWHDAADGNGRSLEIIDPTSDPDQWSNPAAWRPSPNRGGSPGQ